MTTFLSSRATYLITLNLWRTEFRCQTRLFRWDASGPYRPSRTSETSWLYSTIYSRGCAHTAIPFCWGNGSGQDGRSWRYLRSLPSIFSFHPHITVFYTNQSTNQLLLFNRKGGYLHPGYTNLAETNNQDSNLISSSHHS